MAAESEATALDDILTQHPATRQNLIPILQDVQDRLGYLSRNSIDRIASRLDLSANDVYGVATFYTQFTFTPQGKHHIKICRGTACHVRGSNLIGDAVVRKLGIEPGQTTPDGAFSLEAVACFGSCALAPVVVVNEKVYGRMDIRKMEKLIDGLANEL
jgi:NADH-quinone oxidoreductase subunit E